MSFFALAATGGGGGVARIGSVVPFSFGGAPTVLCAGAVGALG